MTLFSDIFVCDKSDTINQMQVTTGVWNVDVSIQMWDAGWTAPTVSEPLKTSKKPNINKNKHKNQRWMTRTSFWRAHRGPYTVFVTMRADGEWETEAVKVISHSWKHAEQSQRRNKRTRAAKVTCGSGNKQVHWHTKTNTKQDPK